MAHLVDSQDKRQLASQDLESIATISRHLSARKPGIKTTEFWVTSLVIVAVVVLVLFDKVSIEQVVDLWPVFVGSGIYTLSRGLVKSGR